MQGPLVLLGPQRPTPNLPETVPLLKGSGPIAVITAGWRHDEADDDSLLGDIGPSATAVPLYSWFEQLAAEAPDIVAAHRQRQRRLKRLKEMYRMRLRLSLDVIRRLNLRLERTDSPDIVSGELEHALEQVRALDDHFLVQSAEEHARFRNVCEPLDHPVVRRAHDKAAETLADARAVVIAGGHVAVLRNRLEFFGVDSLVVEAHERGVPLIAWSAGAMVLTDRIVLFHDDPPQAEGEAELLDLGLGLVPGPILFPHARERLRLDEPNRVATLAARFVPYPCITLENGAWLTRDAGEWANRGTPGTATQLQTDGTITQLRTIDA